MILAKNILRKMIEGYKKIMIASSQEAKASFSINKNVIPIKLVSFPQTKTKEKKVEVDGFEIPKDFKKIKLKETEENEKKLSISYPLVPLNPKKGDKVFAYAKIFWDKHQRRYVYHVIEPFLSPKLNSLLRRLKDLIEQRLDVDLSKLNILEARKYLRKQIDELLDYFKFKLNEEERLIINYYVERDFLGYGKINALMKDPNLEDISCDGVGIPVFVFHKDPRLGSLMTNIVFEDPEELDSFIIRLAQLCGKSVSVAEPLVDGTLPDGSRLQATLATDIARRGSNFTIRKFSREPLTPIHLLKFGTIDVRALAYLWMAVDYGRSILVSGGTASGKTTFLNVLSLFIRPDKKIVSIEDTAELQLPHPHWVPVVARTPISTGKIGEVDLFQLLKESLRQRPDYIILGEVRGKEAYVLFQQMATGHPSLATIHSENLEKLIDRLTTPPISLPRGLIGSLDIVVFLTRMRYKDMFVRKVTQIIEVISFPENRKKPIVNFAFKWNPLRDTFDPGEKSVILKRIAENSGMTKSEILEEMKRRMFILNWMKENNITNYKEVYSVINMYYTSPNGLLSALMGES